MESVITSVDGVQECVVCGTDFGAAAAVVLQPNRDITTRQIHKAVDGMSELMKILQQGSIYHYDGSYIRRASEYDSCFVVKF